MASTVRMPRVLGNLEQQPMFNSLNFAYAALNDAYGVTANSTVVVERKPTRRAF